MDTVRKTNQQMKEVKIMMNLNLEKMMNDAEMEIGTGYNKLFEEREESNELARLRAENESLKKAIESFSQMDKLIVEQKMNKLKNDTEKSLKLEFKEFQFIKESEMNEDQFNAAKSTITRMFRTISRLTGANFQ